VPSQLGIHLIPYSRLEAQVKINKYSFIHECALLPAVDRYAVVGVYTGHWHKIVGGGGF
jgi:hypothetical protein